MELGRSEVGETSKEALELDFDPDKLIGGEGDAPESSDAPEANKAPETVLHDTERLAQPVECLERTQQDCEQLENGNTVFDHPQETGERLNSNQGEAVPGFAGTCGLVSAENIARMAGKDVNEADVVNIACENKDCKHHFWWPAEANGATTPATISDVLGHLGIDATPDFELSIDKLADSVESGHGVIVCVDVSEFWPDFDQEGGHAVTVTSVERDLDSNIVAFYVCDSGTGGDDACRRVDVGLFDSSLDCAIVTNDIIR